MSSCCNNTADSGSKEVYNPFPHTMSDHFLRATRTAPPPTDSTRRPMAMLSSEEEHAHPDNDVDAALQRWVATLAWRQKGNIDDILHAPFPRFPFIHSCFRQYYHKTTRCGNPIYIDVPKATDLAAIEANGISMDELERYFVYSTELLWRVLYPHPNAQALTIMDLQGVKLGDFRGNTVEFTKRCAAICSEHYPERSHHTFIVNAPWAFSAIWAVTKRFIKGGTNHDKIHIYRSGADYQTQLFELCDRANVPVEYGGTCECSGSPPPVTPPPVLGGSDSCCAEDDSSNSCRTNSSEANRMRAWWCATNSDGQVREGEDETAAADQVANYWRHSLDSST